ncbi:MAG: 3-isopropylmalate dehydratase large subunit [Candidatus Omnitrophota bacterium]
MPKTIVEKIMSEHSSGDVKAGDLALCRIDFCFSQDGTSNIVIDQLHKLGVKKLFDSQKIAFVIDHNAPSSKEGASAVHKRMRDFAKEFGMKLYDIGCGVCHQVIPEGGNVLPGNMVLGADSHTCTYGALGAFATGVGSTDLAITAASGKNWFKVPETFKIILSGEAKRGVTAKDIILYIIGKLTADGATYKAVEFNGSYIDKVDMSGRFTICNMAIEMGAKCAFMPVDKKTTSWLKKYNIKSKFNIVAPDKDAIYEKILEYDVSEISPMLAKPHVVDNTCQVQDLENTEINEVYIGTCTNGRLEDLEQAHSILKKYKVKNDIRCIISPASKNIYLEALRLGLIKDFINAGCVIVPPGCGPCVGTHQGVPADNEVVVSTANRNFKGRMGNTNAFIYLASPLTAAASAVTGKITDPRKFI